MRGLLGVSLPNVLELPTQVDCAPNDPSRTCIFMSYGDFANVTVSETDELDDYCVNVEWRSIYARRLEDCFEVDQYFYGGAETLRQYWPNNLDKKNENPYVTADFLAGDEFGGLLDNYWLFSNGVAVHVDEENPLFVSK